MDFVFPRECILCRGNDDLVCNTCCLRIPFINGHICKVCGIPMNGDWVCPDCIGGATFDIARSVFEYNKFTSKLISLYKFSDKIHFANLYSDWITRHLDYAFIGVDCIIPVPLHRLRLFMRKYNQASVLSNILGGKLGIQVDNFNLVRHKYTRAQSSIARSRMRARNVYDAFSVRYPTNIFGKVIMLLDDVMTSGATVKACCAILRQCNPKEIRVTTLARRCIK